MKATFFLIVFATSAITATSQTPQPQKTKEKSNTSFSVYAGANMNNIVGKATATGDKLDNDFDIGFHLGLNVDIPLSPVLFLEPGLQGIRKGAKKKTSTYTYNYDYYYIEMPVHLVYKPQVGKGHVIAGLGGNVAYGISGTWKYDDKVNNLNDDDGKIKFKNSWDANTPNLNGDQYVRPLDVSASLILGYQLHNNLYFQFKGQYSVLNITPKLESAPAGFVQGNAKNLNIGLSVGYRF